MAVDFKDFKALEAKRKPAEPEVIIRTVESSVAWQALQGWVDDQVKVCEAKKASILERYTQDPIRAYDVMLQQKALLDITHMEMIAYATVAEKMRQFHPTEP